MPHSGAILTLLFKRHFLASEEPASSLFSRLTETFHQPDSSLVNLYFLRDSSVFSPPFLRFKSGEKAQKERRKGAEKREIPQRNPSPRGGSKNASDSIDGPNAMEKREPITFLKNLVIEQDILRKIPQQ